MSGTPEEPLAVTDYSTSSRSPRASDSEGELAHRTSTALAAVTVVGNQFVQFSSRTEEVPISSAHTWRRRGGDVSPC
jgi:hypothetical protein